MNTELQTVIEQMERERGIDREILIEAVENALVCASRKSTGQTRDLRIEIDRNTLEIKAMASLEVVDKFKPGPEEVDLHKARVTHPEAQVGDLIDREVTPENFGRIAAQTAKQAILHSLRQAEKDRLYEEYKDREGDIISGAVRRFDRNDVIIDIPKGEGTMPSRERVPTEEYQMGDRIRAYIVSVKATGPEVILSRSHPNFVHRLFEIEVSEIADGTVEIKGIAREAGFRSKVAVLSHNNKVDPVGACVGMRGIRVKNIVRELGGEKIDIVRWHDDVKTFVTNSLAPARLARVDVDEDTRTVKVTVDQDQLSLAIGKKGQNARLTNKLTGWKIDIRKDGPETDFADAVAAAIGDMSKIEGFGEATAEKLVNSGFLSIEGVMAAEDSELVEMADFSAEEAAAIKAAAEKYYERNVR
jgi:N utilization substance protein A